MRVRLLAGPDAGEVKILPFFAARAAVRNGLAAVVDDVEALKETARSPENRTSTWPPPPPDAPPPTAARLHHNRPGRRR